MREIQLKLLCDFILFQSERQRLSKQKLINTGDCVRKGKLTRCWWQYKLGQPRWKLAWQFLRTLEVDFPYDPATPLLGMCRKDPTSYSRDPRSFMFITAPLTIAGTWNRPKCPSNGEWRIKMQYLYQIEWCKKPDWSTRVQHGLGLKCYVTMEAEIRAMALKAKACWVDQKLVGAGEESQSFQRNTAHHLDKNQSIQSVNSLKHGQLLSCVYVQC